MGELTSTRHALQAEARWPITVRCLSVGSFNRLFFRVVVIYKDPHALLGCMFLDISAVSGPIFLKPTLFPLVTNAFYVV